MHASVPVNGIFIVQERSCCCKGRAEANDDLLLAGIVFEYLICI